MMFDLRVVYLLSSLLVVLPNTLFFLLSLQVFYLQNAQEMFYAVYAVGSRAVLLFVVLYNIITRFNGIMRFFLVLFYFSAVSAHREAEAAKSPQYR